MSTHQFREALAKELQGETKERTTGPSPATLVVGGAVLVAAWAVWRVAGRPRPVDDASEEDPLFQKF